MDKQSIYTPGGTIRVDKGIYITRAADEKLLKHCLAGDFCYVLTARQMGKSSLMVHTAKQLNEQGIRTVLVDLTDMGVNVSIDQWYFGLIDIIVSDLDLDVDYVAWWEEHLHLGETQRFTQFLRQVLLEEIDDPIVIFIDEIDTMLSLKFDTTDAERSRRPLSVGADFRADFFAAIRAFYNARSKDPVYQRLTFVLLGVTQPTDLIEDAARTPFNIGIPIDLTDFTLSEALPLATGLELTSINKTEVMERILNLTGGHPYLTQRLCLELTNRSKPVKDEGDIATAAVDLFFKPGSQDPNLRFVRDMLTREPNQVPGLRLYSRILSGERIPGDERIPIQLHLRLSGVVIVQDGFLSIRNKIYEHIFDIRWANNILKSRSAGVVTAPNDIKSTPKPSTITPRKTKDELPASSTIALKISDKPELPDVTIGIPLKESINPVLNIVRNVWAIFYSVIQSLISRFTVLVQKWRTRFTGLRSLFTTWKPSIAEIKLTSLDDLLTDLDIGREWRLQLAQANMPVTVGQYVFIYVISTLLMSLLAFFVLFPWNIFMTVTSAVVGAIIPRIYIGIRQDKYLYDFEQQLADAISFMANGLRSGYSLLQAMDAVGRGFPFPISIEFRRWVREVGLGLDPERAFDNLLRRVPSGDLNLVITTILVQAEVGGNLAEILETINFVIRERIRIAGQIARLFKPIFFYQMLIVVTTIMFVVQGIIFSTYFSLAWQTELGQRTVLLTYWLLSTGLIVGTILIQIQYKTFEHRIYLAAFWRQLALDLILWGISAVIVFRTSVPSAILVWFALMLFYRISVRSRFIYLTLTWLIVVLSVLYLLYITGILNSATYSSISTEKAISTIQVGLESIRVYLSQYESIRAINAILPYVLSETIRWTGYILIVSIIWFLLGEVANVNVSRLGNSRLISFYGRSKKAKSLMPALSSDSLSESLISYPTDIIDLATSSETELPAVKEETRIENIADTSSIQPKLVDVNIRQILQTNQEYLQQGLVRTATEHCYWGISLDPYNLLLHRQLAKIYISMGRESEATAQYRIIACTYRLRGELRHVVGLYNRILKIEPVNIVVQKEFTELLTSLGMLDEALEKSLLLAYTYYTSGQVDEALKQYNRSLALAPYGSSERNWPLQILHTIADMNIQKLQWESAKEICSQIKAQTPSGEKRTYEYLIDLYFKIGESRLALMELDELLALCKDEGDLNTARNVLGALTQTYPNEVELSERMDKINEL